VGEGIVEFGT